MSSDDQRGDHPPRDEDRDRGADSSSGFHRPARVDRPGEPEPFSLEESELPAAPRPAPARPPAGATGEKSPEECPNCGAVMPDRHALVCLRCGYDQKTLRVQSTHVSKKPVEVDDDNEGEERAGPPLIHPGRGDLWLPLMLAGIGIFALLVGHLAGAAGLFTQAMIDAEGTAGISFLDRLNQFARAMILIALWTSCGVAGLFLLAQTVQRVFGDLTLAAARMLGIIAVIRLASFLELPSAVAEWIVEWIIQGAAFVVIAILLFTLKPRDGLVLGGFSLLAWVVLWVSANLITWVAA